MKIIVLNKLMAENYIFPEPHIFISIFSPGATKACLPVNPFRKAELFLCFHDITNHHLEELAKDSISLEKGLSIKKEDIFSDAFATRIWNFVKTYITDPEIKTICVNCEAGVSRSAGVGSALAKVFNGDKNDFWDRKNCVPNSLVYRTLLNSWKGLNGKTL